VVALAGAASGAAAQCSVYRLNVPDFDQRRDPAQGIPGLPGDGNCYCVPTSAINWMAYISNHGYPSVANGPRNWQSNTHYNYVTTLLGLMGLIMETGDGVDPNGCGTSGTNHQGGMHAWLDSFEPGKFVVSRKGTSGGFGPTPFQAYQKMSFGALVNITLGRYAFIPPNTPPGYPVGRWVRTGGHVMSLTRVYDACSATPEFWYRDPAGFDGADTDQSQFVTQHSEMVEYTGFFASDGVSPPELRTVWTYADVDGFDVFDSFTAICAMYGLTADPQTGQVGVFSLYDFDNLATLPPQMFGVPGAEILALASDPALGSAAVVARSGTSAVLSRLDLGDGSVRTLATLPPGPAPALISTEWVFVAIATPSGSQIQAIPWEDRAAVPPAPLPIPGTVAAMASDRPGDEIAIIIYPAPGAPPRIGRVASDLSGYTDEAIPTGASIVGDPSLAIGPDGAMWLASSGVNGIVKLERGAAGGLIVAERVAHPSIVGPRNLKVDHLGSLLFASEGRIRVLRRDAAGGWALDPDHALAGQQVSAVLDVAASTDLGAEWDNTPGDVDLEPPPDLGPGVPDCPGDFNGDLALNSQDFFDFLAAFFAGHPSADVNLDGTINSQDFFDFLRAFFAGCE
jgi:hypothetical protein